MSDQGHTEQSATSTTTRRRLLKSVAFAGSLALGGSLVATEADARTLGSPQRTTPTEASLTEPTVVWDRRYEAGRQGSAKDVVRTDDGFVVAGDSISFGHGGSDGTVLRTDDDGEQEWFRAYGRRGFDDTDALLETDDGYLLAGDTREYGGSQNDYLLFEIDDDGDVAWTKRYDVDDGADSHDPRLLRVDDGYALLGNYYKDGQVGFDVLKVGADGTRQWYEKHASPFDTSVSLRGAIRTADGGFAVVGYKRETVCGGDDVVVALVKLDAAGEEQWTRTYDWEATRRAEAHDVVQTPDGGFALVGGVAFEGEDSQPFLVRTAADGTVRWKRRYPDYRGDDGYHLLRTDGGFVAHFDDFRLVKLDALGNEQWVYEDTDGDAASIIEVEDGLVLAGSLDFAGAHGDAYTRLLKLRTPGVLGDD